MMNYRNGITTKWIPHAPFQPSEATALPNDNVVQFVTILFSAIVFHEKVTRRFALGLTIFLVGTLLML